MVLLTEKYKPRNLKEIEGHDKSIDELRSFVRDYHGGALIIYGGVGNGKTTSVYALAKDLGYEIIEVNASDYRNKEDINLIVGNTSQQMSLFAKGKIILIDDIEGMSGNSDRGGVQAIGALIEKSRWPIIITTNDPWDKKFSDLRNKSQLLEFRTLNYLTIARVLKKICDIEKIKLSEDDIKSLARKSNGDLRAAINDLQVLVVDSDIGELHEREYEGKILDSLKLIFKSSKAENVLGVFDKSTIDLDEAKLWIDENLPSEYKDKEDLDNAYYYLSRADVFNGRIRRWQHWRFLVYINNFLTAGIALSKKERNNNFFSYKRTSRILKLWQANMRYAKRKAIAGKIAKNMHCSTRKAISDILPYIQVIIKKNDCSEMIKRFELNDDEIKWLKTH